MTDGFPVFPPSTMMGTGQIMPPPEAFNVPLVTQGMGAPYYSGLVHSGPALANLWGSDPGIAIFQRPSGYSGGVGFFEPGSSGLSGNYSALPGVTNGASGPPLPSVSGIGFSPTTGVSLPTLGFGGMEQPSSVTIFDRPAGYMGGVGFYEPSSQGLSGNYSALPGVTNGAEGPPLPSVSGIGFSPTTGVSLPTLGFGGMEQPSSVTIFDRPAGYMGGVGFYEPGSSGLSGNYSALPGVTNGASGPPLPSVSGIGFSPTVGVSLPSPGFGGMEQPTSVSILQPGSHAVDMGGSPSWAQRVTWYPVFPEPAYIRPEDLPGNFSQFADGYILAKNNYLRNLHADRYQP